MIILSEHRSPSLGGFAWRAVKEARKGQLSTSRELSRLLRCKRMTFATDSVESVAAYRLPCSLA